MIDTILNSTILISILKVLAFLAEFAWLGFGGFLFWYTIRLKDRPSFKTTYWNAMHSDDVTRIVQGRFNNGKRLEFDERKDILMRFGPQTGKGFFKSHYKDVVINKSYFKRNKS